VTAATLARGREPPPPTPAPLREPRRGGAAQLLLLLSVVAGSVDAIAFFAFGGLFPNHVTGNLALLAARVAGMGHATLAMLLAVPVFVATVMATTLVVSRLHRSARATLTSLLWLHLLLLVGFLAMSLAAGPHPSPDARGAVVAGLLGVVAMGVQNALVQLVFTGSPPTAVMTGNVMRLAIDLARWIGLDGTKQGTAERRAVPATLSPVLGFAAGAALGVSAELRVGPWSLVLPVVLATIALVIGYGIEPHARPGHAGLPFPGTRPGPIPAIDEQHAGRVT
jgi:uncharacterized membrane protein YoaK (UPF0700 family)